MSTIYHRNFLHFGAAARPTFQQLSDCLMKNIGRFLSTGLMAATMAAPFDVDAQLNCYAFPNYVATVSQYPAACCTLTSPTTCQYAAVLHTVPMDFSVGHPWSSVCMDLGANANADSRIALCFGRIVSPAGTSSFLSNPVGEAIVFELDLSKTPDMLYVWTYADSTKTILDSTVALANTTTVSNGSTHFMEYSYNAGDPSYPGDSNKYRMVLKLDGVIRFNFRYNLPALLWGGDALARVWVTGESGPSNLNTQVACLFAYTCTNVQQQPIPLAPVGTPIDREVMTGIPSPSETVTLSPNPVNNSLLVTATQGFLFRLVNLQGIRLDLGVIGVGQTTISTANLPNGVYFLDLLSADSRKTIKFLVQH